MNKQSAHYKKINDIITLVEKQSQVLGHKTLYTLVEDNLREAQTVTFKQLEKDVKALAAVMQNTVKPGARVLLLYPAGYEYIKAYFACLFAGLVAVPAYAIQSPKDHSRLNSIMEDAEAELICITQSQQTVTNQWLKTKNVQHSLTVLCTDNLKWDQEWKKPNIDGATLAFLQYTSGSTGNPKGVMVNHQNLIHNSEIIYRAFDMQTDTICASWLPPYHDMGLIGGILQPLFAGVHMVLMSPMSFLKRPIRWLEVISKYQVTISGGPNFAYDFCVNRIKEQAIDPLNLSSWKVAFNGAEPIRAETLKKFHDKFNRVGFQEKAFFPCYGLAEATLFVSGNSVAHGVEYTTVNQSDLQKGKNLNCSPLTRQIIEKTNLHSNKSNHHTTLDTTINTAINTATNTAKKTPHQILISSGLTQTEECRIVDPDTLAECKDGCVGEIWVSSLSCAQGYWRKPQASIETFHAQIVNDSKTPNALYMRTGDLGYFNQQRLIVTGRCKELMIINGRNIYPQDVERSIQQSHDLIREGFGAAVSTPGDDGTEQLIIIQEIERKVKTPTILTSIYQAILQNLNQEWQLTAKNIVLISASSLPKTTSGKIQRGKAGLLLEKNELNIIYQRTDWLLNQKKEFANQAKPVGEQQNSTNQIAMLNENKKLTKTNSTASDSRVNQTTQRWINSVSEIIQPYLEPDIIFDPQTPFSTMGLGSKEVVSIAGELEEISNNTLNTTLLYEYPTVATLAEYLAGFNKKRTLVDQQQSQEPIAIIGMACHFPGANSIDEFWTLLSEGKNAITEIPENRWQVDQYFSKENIPGKMCTTKGGFIQHEDKFDAAFFGITAREARVMDPQQRILLQNIYHAIEDAQIPVSQLKTQPVGVYVGASTSDYARLLGHHEEAVSAWAGTGNALSILANRISYLLGLQGPSLTVDTACSSSLTALHLAKNSLQTKESHISIVSGVNLILTPDLHITFSQAEMLAPDGQCKTFDNHANGYVRAEGCGTVLLKPLSAALKDGNKIYACIAGSAINQDGSSNGLTAPNGLSQQQVIQQALHNADLTPTDIHAIECHGTGTKLGDPIELGAIAKVFNQKRKFPLKVGSVKSNIGHLESAAGIAGLIKSALCLHHGQLAPSINVTNPTNQFQWQAHSIEIAKTLTTFNTAEKHSKTNMGLSGFGFGGSNAHVILSTAPLSHNVQKNNHHHQQATTKKPMNKPFLIGFSAKSLSALNHLSEQWRVIIDQKIDQPQSLAMLEASALLGRQHYLYRSAYLVNSHHQTIHQLQPNTNILTKPNSCWLFTGQGSQYIGMAQKLYESLPVFKHSIDECAHYYSQIEGIQVDLRNILFEQKAAFNKQAGVHNDTALINQTRYTQPALFALEVSLAKIYQHEEILPTQLIGHSVGEYAAAHIAGIFSLQDGIKLIAARGELMEKHCHPGAMLAILSHLDYVTTEIERYDRLSIAAINTPSSIVISGDIAQIEQIKLNLTENNVRFKQLNVKQGFHSPLMQPMLDEFRKVALSIQYKENQIPIHSTVNTKHPMHSAEYWITHIEQPVLFKQAIEKATQNQVNHWLELGPANTLIGMAKQCVNSETINQYYWTNTLSQEQCHNESLLAAIAHCYIAGETINGFNFLNNQQKEMKKIKVVNHHKANLPLYPFDKNRHWVKQNHTDATVHWREAIDVLGKKQFVAPANLIYSLNLNHNHPYDLTQHKINHQLILAGASHVSSWLEILKRHHQPCYLTNIQINEALTLDDEQSPQLQYQWQQQSLQLSAYAKANHADEWKVYASAEHLEENEWRLKNKKISFPKDLIQSANLINATELYDALYESGYQYGESFQWLNQFALFNHNDFNDNKFHAYGCIKKPNNFDHKQKQYTLPPGCLDSCFHLAALVIQEKGQSVLLENQTKQTHVYLPVGINSLLFDNEMFNLMHTDDVMHLLIRQNPSSDNKIISMDILAFNENKQVVLKIDNLMLKRVPKRLLKRASSPKTLAWEKIWQTTPIKKENIKAESWCISHSEKLNSSFLKQSINNQTSVSVKLTNHFQLIPDCDRWLWIVPEVYTMNELKQIWLALQNLAQVETVDFSPLKELIVLAPNSLDHSENLQINYSSVLAGWLRTFNNEIGTLPIKLIDCAIDNINIAQLMHSILTKPNEMEFKLSQHEVHFSRWKRPQKLRSHHSWQHRCVLITGAQGDIGKHLISYCASKGVQEIMGVGRRPCNDKFKSWAFSLGIKLHWVTADISDKQSLEQSLINKLSQLSTPITAIFHAAGLTIDASFNEADWQNFETIAQAKIQGTQNLFDIVQQQHSFLQPKAWYLFSSISASLGNIGQAHYAAANAYIDAFSAYLTNQGIQSFCINWGPWKNTQMVKSMGQAKTLVEQNGLWPMTPQSAMIQFDELLSYSNHHWLVASIDQTLFAHFPGAEHPAFTNLLIHNNDNSDRRKWLQLLEKMNSESPQTRKKLMQEVLIERTKKVLEMNQNTYLDPDKALQELGLDSMLAVDLRNQLNQLSGLKLSATLLFDYPTLSKITDYLLAQLFVVGTTIESTKKTTDTAINQSLNDDQLDDELEQLLVDLEE